MANVSDSALQASVDAIKNLLTSDGKIDATELQKVFTDMIDSKVNNANQAAGGFQAFAALTDAATIAWDCATGYNKTVEINGNRTLSISNAADGSVGCLFVTQGGAGFKTLTLPGSSHISGGFYQLSTAPSLVDVLIFIKKGTAYYWFISNNVLPPS